MSKVRAVVGGGATALLGAALLVLATGATGTKYGVCHVNARGDEFTAYNYLEVGSLSGHFEDGNPAKPKHGAWDSHAQAQRWDFVTVLGDQDCDGEKDRTPTPTLPPTATATSEPTATATLEPTATASPEPTATEPEATATASPEATATASPEPTATATPNQLTETPDIACRDSQGNVIEGCHHGKG